MIERIRCYLLRCYLGDIEADLKGGLEELGWTKNPTEGKLKVGLAETKSDKKKSVWGNFAEYENLIFLELLYVLHDKYVKPRGRNTICRSWKETKAFLTKVQCIFHTRNYFTKE